MAAHDHDHDEGSNLSEMELRVRALETILVDKGYIETAALDRIAGGRIYDAHIAEVARAAGATVVVTDNRRHFLAALKYGLRVETPAEFVTTLKNKSD